MSAPLEGRFDDAVVGAGIVGLAHAYQLARRGRRVAVFERGPRAQGASVRNFGMLWPIGQPAGRLRRLALRSLDQWLEILGASGLWHARCGSLHLAYRDDEAQVLREFAGSAAAEGLACRLVDAREARERAGAVRAEGLRGALWSPTEAGVDPREVAAGLPGWLERRHGVRFFFGTTVVGYDRPWVRAGERGWGAERLFICSGDDLQTLYPEAFAGSGLLRVKLQMLRTQAYGEHFRLGPHLAAGLTLRHYDSFAGCPSLGALRERFAREMPEYDRFGIHVMASQNGRGEVVIGDSHEHAEEIEVFDKAEIDELVLRYLRTFLDLPDLRIAARWHGVYVKHPSAPCFRARPAPGVTVVTGLGGAGMTLAFGVAEETVREELEGGSGMPIELVVFDLAGTTVRDDGAVNRCFRAALEAAGLRVPAPEVDRVMGLAKPEAIRLLLERAPGGERLLGRAGAIHADFEARMARFYAEDPSVGEIQGASDCFRRLKAAGIRVALNTGFGRAITDAVLRRVGWLGSPLVDATLSSDEVPRGRPHPDMIRRFMERLEVVDPRRVAKVGDTPADLGEGAGAGCGLNIGVTTGASSREELARHPHTHLLGSVAELPALLGL